MDIRVDKSVLIYETKTKIHPPGRIIKKMPPLLYQVFYDENMVRKPTNHLKGDY